MSIPNGARTPLSTLPLYVPNDAFFIWLFEGDKPTAPSVLCRAVVNHQFVLNLRDLSPAS
jgi:hypothetical protein